jgi:hypothetical protein
MVEPPQLLSAREHLALAEAKYRSEDGLFHLEEGLALLEEVMAGPSPGHRAVAQNLAATYSVKFYNVVRNLVARDRALPEPDLEHLFRVVRAFDDRGLDLPADIRSTKIELVRRLIARYYEGHSPAEQRAALERLAKITGEPPARE